MRRSTAAKLALLAVLAGVLVILLIQVAGGLDISDSRLAFDWKIIHAGLNDADNHWSGGLYNPPWVVLALLPLGRLSVAAGWLLIVIFSLAVVVVGVQPKRPPWQFALAAVLVVLAFPTMRSLVDGNVDALAIAGVLLLMVGLERKSSPLLIVGALAATAKPQSTWLVLLFVGVALLRAGAWRTLFSTSAGAGAVMALTLLWGGADWFASMGRIGSGIALRGLIGSVTDSGIVVVAAISLVAAVTLWAAWRVQPPRGLTLYGLLVAASLLTAPYGNALSLSGVMLLGVVPLAFARPLLGVPVYLLFIAPYLGLGDVMGLDQTVYRFLGLALLIAWGALLAHSLLGVRRSGVAPAAQAVSVFSD